LPAEAEIHEAAADRLDDLGQKYTTGRRTLVDVLTGLRGPVTIDAIRQERDLPLSSVYRNLVVLEEAGIVRRVNGVDEAPRFELAEDLTEHHHHLVCTSCGKVEDFVVPPGLERALNRAVHRAAEQKRFHTSGHQLDLVGLCADCHQR
jgi:Fe2+ or Zn2+ uptake regulation protein